MLFKLKCCFLGMQTHISSENTASSLLENLPNNFKATPGTTVLLLSHTEKSAEEGHYITFLIRDLTGKLSKIKVLLMLQDKTEHTKPWQIHLLCVNVFIQ